MDASVGDHRFAVRVDGDHGLLEELDVRLDDVSVSKADLVQAASAEHHIELGEPKDKGVALVYQRHLNLVPEPLGQPGRQLEATEPGAKDQNP